MQPCSVDDGFLMQSLRHATNDLIFHGDERWLAITHPHQRKVLNRLRTIVDCHFPEGPPGFCFRGEIGEHIA